MGARGISAVALDMLLYDTRPRPLKGLCAQLDSPQGSPPHPFGTQPFGSAFAGSPWVLLGGEKQAPGTAVSPVHACAEFLLSEKET